LSQSGEQGRDWPQVPVVVLQFTVLFELLSLLVLPHRAKRQRCLGLSAHSFTATLMPSFPSAPTIALRLAPWYLLLLIFQRALYSALVTGCTGRRRLKSRFQLECGAIHLERCGSGECKL
jgi:hypothetical protein